MKKMERPDVFYKEKFQSLWGVIKKEIRLSDIADTMVENGVLSLENWEELKTAHITERERTERFLFFLINQNNSEHFQAFIDAVKNTGRQDLASRLQPKDINIPNLHLNRLQMYNQDKIVDAYDGGAESGYPGSDTAVKDNVTKIEQLMERLEMMYERQESKIDLVLSEQQTARYKMDSVISEQQTARCKLDSVISEQEKTRSQINLVLTEQHTAREKMEVLMDNNETITSQMGNIAADIETTFETFETFHKDKNKDYEILKKKHDGLLEECKKKEEELKALQSQIQSQKSDLDAQGTEKYETLQNQFIALKEKNEERIQRLKGLNQEIVTFRKKYAEAFHVPQPEHLGEILEHFESIQGSMQRLKHENDSLTQKIEILKKDNENLMKRNHKLDEELINVEKMLGGENERLMAEKEVLEEELARAQKIKSKTPERIKSSKGQKEEKPVFLKVKGKKYH